MFLLSPLALNEEMLQVQLRDVTDLLLELSGAAREFAEKQQISAQP